MHKSMLFSWCNVHRRTGRWDYDNRIGVLDDIIRPAGAAQDGSAVPAGRRRHRGAKKTAKKCKAIRSLHIVCGAAAAYDEIDTLAGDL
jgi:hypothetical protein